MKKKHIIILCLAIIGVGLIFGMKKYVDSYAENQSTNIGAENKIEESENKDEIKDENKSEKKSDDDKKETSTEKTDYYAATDFTLKDLDGNEIKLSDYKGKKVFLNFWATWCGYCVKEMPDIQKLYEEINKDEYEVLTINVGEKRSDIDKFIEGKGFTFKILEDSNLDVSAQYGAMALPMSVLIGTNGEPIAVIKGMMTYDQMKEFIARDPE